MIQVESSVIIERPANEVFEYLTNFENNPQWQSGMQKAYFTSEGALDVGSTYSQVARFLGRKIESNFVVVAYEPGSMVKITSTSGSFPITVTRSVKPTDLGTEVKAIVEGDATGFFKLAEPIMRRMVQRSVDGDYARLKELLEAKET